MREEGAWERRGESEVRECGREGGQENESRGEQRRQDMKVMNSREKRSS
jgi:hypothetical protein